MIAKAYMTSYRLPVITTRSNNVYGPRQFPEKLIGKFTLLASRNEDLPIHGDGVLPANPSTRPHCFCNIYMTTSAGQTYCRRACGEEKYMRCMPTCFRIGNLGELTRC